MTIMEGRGEMGEGSWGRGDGGGDGSHAGTCGNQVGGGRANVAM